MSKIDPEGIRERLIQALREKGWSELDADMYTDVWDYEALAAPGLD